MPQHKRKDLYLFHLPFTYHELIQIFNKAHLHYLENGIGAEKKELMEREVAIMGKVAVYLKENT